MIQLYEGSICLEDTGDGVSKSVSIQNIKTIV